MYLAFNHSREDFQNQFTTFANGMIADLTGKPVNRVIIEALVKYAKQSAFNAAKFYGLIGRDTFSAGMFHAYQLQQELGATLIGEPTGGRPWASGHVGQFSLPFSRLTVQYSTQFYRLTPEDRETLPRTSPSNSRLPTTSAASTPWLASALSGGAKPGLVRLSEIRLQDDAPAETGSHLGIRVTAADASIFFGHTEADVLERTATEDAWQITVRVPADLKGEIAVYAVAAGELSNPVNVHVR